MGISVGGASVVVAARQLARHAFPNRSLPMTNSALSAFRRGSLISLLCVSWTASAIVFGAEQTRSRFDLPADTADKSLRLFSAQSGLEVLFATDVAAGVRTNAVKGEFTALEAASRLLSGTSLTIVRDDKNGVLRVARLAKKDQRPPRKKPPCSPRPRLNHRSRALSPHPLSKPAPAPSRDACLT